MNIKFNLSTSFVLVIIVLFSSCKKSEDNPADAGNANTVTGFVELYDTVNVMMKSHTGVVVSASGSSKQAITDQTGKFNLSIEESGTYTLTFQKGGFGSFKKYGINTPATIEKLRLGQQPVRKMTSLGALKMNGTIKISFSVTTAIKDPKGYIFYFNTADNVSSAPGENVFALAVYADSTNNNTFIVDSTTIRRMGVRNSQMLSIIGYGFNSSAPTYVDMDLNRTVYTGTGPTGSSIVKVSAP
jgi:hypothetical protein